MSKSTPSSNHIFKSLNRLPIDQRMSLAAIAIIALALPIGVWATNQTQSLRSLAYYKQSNPTALHVSSLTSPSTSKNECLITGCSSELCVSSKTGPIATICKWDDSYACYRGAACEVQDNGNCGWTIDPSLKTCLDQTNWPIIPPNDGTTRPPLQPILEPTLKSQLNPTILPDVSPSIDTRQLPLAKVGQRYQTTIKASSPNPKDSLHLTLTHLPPGLEAGECSDSSSKNRSTITCSISGIPTKSGSFELLTTVSNSQGSQDQQWIPLIIKDSNRGISFPHWLSI